MPDSPTECVGHSSCARIAASADSGSLGWETELAGFPTLPGQVQIYDSQYDEPQDGFAHRSRVQETSFSHPVPQRCAVLYAVPGGFQRWHAGMARPARLCRTRCTLQSPTLRNLLPGFAVGTFACGLIRGGWHPGPAAAQSVTPRGTAASPSALPGRFCARSSSVVGGRGGRAGVHDRGQGRKSAASWPASRNRARSLAISASA